MKRALFGLAVASTLACACHGEDDPVAEPAATTPAASADMATTLDMSQAPADMAAVDMSDPVDMTGAPDAPAEAGCMEPAGVVTFQTSDGVTLEADYIPARTSGRGAVLFFHMIPPSNDRTGYPARVREALAALDLTVLNVDRRGAGGSGGVASEAYTGESASLDVEAGVRFLLEREEECRPNRDALMLVGASNGTTSVLDYVLDRKDSALPAPAAAAWLSPGSYTENQSQIAGSSIESTPVLILHPDNEPWARQYAGKHEAWRVIEIADGRHGTSNFDDGAREDVQLGELLGWATRHLGE